LPGTAGFDSIGVMKWVWIVLIAVVGLGAAGGGIWYMTRADKPLAETSLEVEEGTGAEEEVAEELIPTLTTSKAVSPSAAADSKITEGQVKEIRVKGSNFKFDPAEIRVKKGETIRLVFESMDGMHDWNLDAFEAQTNVIGEGEEEEVEFTANKKGTFEYYCSVEDHKARGMKGKFIVE